MIECLIFAFQGYQDRIFQKREQEFFVDNGNLFSPKKGILAANKRRPPLLLKYPVVHHYSLIRMRVFFKNVLKNAVDVAQW